MFLVIRYPMSSNSNGTTPKRMRWMITKKISVGYIHLNAHVVTMASHPTTTMPLSQSYHHWYLHLFMFSNFSIWHTWYTSHMVIATIFPYLPPSIYPWWFACYVWFTFRCVCISACVHAHVTHAHVEVNAAWKQLIQHNGLLVFMKRLEDSILLSICHVN